MCQGGGGCETALMGDTGGVGCMLCTPKPCPRAPLLPLQAVDDPCMQGGKGYQECGARTDGKTQVWLACQPPFRRPALVQPVTISAPLQGCGRQGP
jgi:hypothetical protein